MKRWPEGVTQPELTVQVVSTGAVAAAVWDIEENVP
jgi:hypothetical protein